MSVTITINIARDFSRFPAGRYLDDGPYSGAAFRDRYMKPALDRGETLVIELDGVRGYGSSFLEEAFGGLVRLGLSSESVKQAIRLKSNDDSLVKEVLEYIENGLESAEDGQ